MGSKQKQIEGTDLIYSRGARVERWYIIVKVFMYMKCSILDFEDYLFSSLLRAKWKEMVLRLTHEDDNVRQGII